jgi:hypothetical protein
MHKPTRRLNLQRRSKASEQYPLHTSDRWYDHEQQSPSPLQGSFMEQYSVCWQPPNIFPRSRYFFTLKTEETRSSETSVYIKPTQRHIPQDGILQNTSGTLDWRIAYPSRFTIQMASFDPTSRQRGRPQMTGQWLKKKKRSLVKSPRLGSTPRHTDWLSVVM